MYAQKLALETVFVAVMLAIIGVAVSYSMIYLKGIKTGYPDRDALKNMICALMISGAVFHLSSEASGLNKWYITNSAAAM